MPKLGGAARKTWNLNSLLESRKESQVCRVRNAYFVSLRTSDTNQACPTPPCRIHVHSFIMTSESILFCIVVLLPFLVCIPGRHDIPALSCCRVLLKLVQQASPAMEIVTMLQLVAAASTFMGCKNGQPHLLQKTIFNNSHALQTCSIAPAVDKL